MSDDQFERLDKLVQQSLSRDPGGDVELSALAELAGRLNQLLPPPINPAAFARTLLEVERLSSSKARRFMALFSPSALVKVASYAVAVLLTAGVVGSSAYSLPGSWLYPIKLVSQKVTYVFTPDDNGKAELHIIFSEEKMRELEKKFSRDQQIDQKVLAAALDEARSALQIAANLPSDKQDHISERVDRATDRHIHTLNILDKTARPADKLAIRNARVGCEQMQQACCAMNNDHCKK